MRPSFLQALFAAALLLAAHVDGAAGEPQRVHRCVGVRGEIVFTDAPCDSQALAGISAGAMASPSAAPPADSCPTTGEELRERVAAAIARNDANAIAGMLQWRGIGGGAAATLLRQIAELVRLPLLELELSEGLRIRTGSNTAGGTRELRFGIERSSGCWWLTW